MVELVVLVEEVVVLVEAVLVEAVVDEAVESPFGCEVRGSGSNILFLPRTTAPRATSGRKASAICRNHTSHSSYSLQPTLSS